MSEIVDKFNNLFKRHPLLSFLLSSGLLAVLINIISAILSDILGVYVVFGLIIILIIFIIVILFTYIWHQDKKRKDFGQQTFEPLKKKYKGLIVPISKIEHSKEELIDKINSLKNSNDAKGLNELYGIKGIGQVFIAVNHHLEKLEVCWLLYTQASVDGKEVVKYFIKKFSSATVKPILLEQPYNVKSTYKTINEIYMKGLEEVNLCETEVIIDITGGTSPTSSAIMLACMPLDRCIEYVEQGTNKLIEIEHI